MSRRASVVLFALLASVLVAAAPGGATHSDAGTDPCGPGADPQATPHPDWADVDLCAAGVTQVVDGDGVLVGFELWMEVDGEIALADGYGRHEWRVESAYDVEPLVQGGGVEGCVLEVLVRGGDGSGRVFHNGTCDGGGFTSWFEQVVEVPAEVVVDGGRLAVVYDVTDLDPALRDALTQPGVHEPSGLQVEARIGRPSSSLSDVAHEVASYRTFAVPTDRMEPVLLPLRGVVPPQACTDHGPREQAGTPLAHDLCRADLAAVVDGAGELSGLRLDLQLRDGEAAAIESVSAVLRTQERDCYVGVSAERLPTGDWRVAADGDGCGLTAPGGAWLWQRTAVMDVPGGEVTTDGTRLSLLLPADTGNAWLAALATPGAVLDGYVDVGRVAEVGSTAADIPPHRLPD